MRFDVSCTCVEQMAGVKLAKRTGERPAEGQGRGTTSDRLMIQAVLKALAVLSLFDTLQPQWTIDQMMEETGLPRMAVYRIAKTLESVGYLAGDASSGSYRIGPALLAITHINAGWAADIKKAARPYLEELAAQTEETVTLAIEKDGAAVEMDGVETSRPFRRGWAPGRIIGYSTAHGKIFSAFKSSFTQKTILGSAQYLPIAGVDTEPDDRASKLEAVRRDGVAFSIEEAYAGICAVAAPVRDQFGSVVASIAVLAPPGRFGPEERRAHAEAVKASAATLSAFLGYLDSEQKSEALQLPR